MADVVPCVRGGDPPGACSRVARVSSSRPASRAAGAHAPLTTNTALYCRAFQRARVCQSISMRHRRIRRRPQLRPCPLISYTYRRQRRRRYKHAKAALQFTPRRSESTPRYGCTASRLRPSADFLFKGAARWTTYSLETAGADRMPSGPPATSVGLLSAERQSSPAAGDLWKPVRVTDVDTAGDLEANVGARFVIPSGL